MMSLPVLAPTPKLFPNFTVENTKIHSSQLRKVSFGALNVSSRKCTLNNSLLITTKGVLSCDPRYQFQKESFTIETRVCIILFMLEQFVSL